MSLRTPQVSFPPDAASEQTVRRFYNAVNVVLHTGNTASLDRAGLGSYLVALHANFPQMQLAIEALTVAGDEVMTQVSVLGAERGAFLGMPLTGQVPTWSRVERFRVADGWIVERWADSGSLMLLQPLQQIQIETQPPLQQIVTIRRVTVAPGKQWRWPNLFIGQHLLYVEAGNPTVLIDAALAGPALLTLAPARGGVSPQESVEPGTERTLAPGSLLLLSTGVTGMTGTDEQAPAVFLLITMAVPEALPESMAARSWAEDQERSGKVLTTDLPTTLPLGSATVAIGRAMLPPGAAIPAHPAAGTELVVVEAGTLVLSSTGGIVWLRRSTTARPTTATELALTANDGALIAAGSSCAYRNAGDDPLVLLLVTIRPADSGDPGSG